MATSNSTRTGHPPKKPTDLVLSERIDTQRRRLMEVSAVVGCLGQALGETDIDRAMLDFQLVTDVCSRMLEDAAEALDPVALGLPIPGGET